MGNYLTYSATVNDLDRFVTERTLENILADIDTVDDRIDSVNGAIDASESEVNSFVGVQFTVPITLVPIPEVVVDAAAVLTIERLYNRGTGPPQSTADRAEQIRSWLKLVAEGKASIEGLTNAPSVTASSGVVIVDSETRELTRTKLGFLSD